MKGYHYTSLTNYRKIAEEGLLPAPITNPDLLKLSVDTRGIWLCRDPQEGESLLGLLIERFVVTQDWKIVELEVDFKIKNCVRSLEEGYELKLTHSGICNGWVYHENLPVFVVRKKITKIKLRRVFDLYPREE